MQVDTVYHCDLTLHTMGERDSIVSSSVRDMLYLFYVTYMYRKKNGKKNPDILAVVVILLVVLIFLFILLYIL